MPNEQITVPLFTAGEVLTAANMNISAGTGVPVFANTTTRDAGFGGANEKVLAEGQLCYLSSTNVVQYYDGAAWATVGPAASGALTCVKAETSFSAVSSIQVNSVFSATYTNYLVKVLFTSNSNAADGVYLRVSASGTPSTTNYDNQQLTQTNTTVTGGQGLADQWFSIGSNASGTVGGYIDINLMNPFSAASTYVYSREWMANKQFFQSGIHTTATSYDGFTVVTNGMTLTGSYTVYGYGKTV